MELTMLGTGNAMVTECYNTCFVMQEDDKYFLVDCGGGNGLLHQLKEANLNWKDMRDIFITHKHLDHFMGAIWMVRMICQNMSQGSYDGEARIYGHEEVIRLLREISMQLLPEKVTKYIDDRLHLIEVSDGQQCEIIGKRIQFFDIGSTKAKQYGFSMDLGDDRKLTCLGDEPCSESGMNYAKDSEWLLHEAFCLYEERDIFHPYEKHHSTALDAAKLAEDLKAKNLILYHTEEKHLSERKQKYTKEAKAYFSGNVFVPDDLEKIEL